MKTSATNTNSIDISEKAGIRYLHFGSHWVQGAMRIKRPFDLELAYAQDMLAGLLLRDRSTWPHAVLQIGLGAGSLVKWCHRHLPNAQTTAVEIDPRVYAAARQFFMLPSNDERLQVEIGDGVAYLKESQTQWDLILLDGYDAQGKPGALDSEGFYTLCREKLSDSGLLAINLLGLAHTYPESLGRIQQVFGNHLIALPACNSGNRIVLASRAPLPSFSAQDPHELVRRMHALQDQTGLSLLSLLERMDIAA